MGTQEEFDLVAGHGRALVTSLQAAAPRRVQHVEDSWATQTPFVSAPSLNK